eukprot:TRINITY_DN1486_c0_g2_i1.p1 TRINITY_DN1486_c0_g2~~TRINITY_DN1486_c0_g2_i1.p1  ORF type:complete len:755 (-),score=154.22 TRINITY_DN1486_c0_g2_i1:1417-3507(-)
MSSGMLQAVLSIILFRYALQQTTEEVVLDPEGQNLTKFENQAEKIIVDTFKAIETASEDSLQGIITDFSKNLGLSVANVVIFFNSQGFDSPDESAKAASSALKSAFAAALKKSAATFESFDYTAIVNVMEDSVRSVLEQLQNGKGINEVINFVANNVLESAYNTLEDLVDNLNSAAEKRIAREDVDEVAPPLVVPAEEAVAKTTENQADTSAAVSGYLATGKFQFTGQVKSVEELRNQIIAQAESGFVIIETSEDPEGEVTRFAANITQQIGEVLLTVLNAEDDVDKETEAEAIADAVGSALSVAAADARGSLKDLDIVPIQNEVVAAIFNAITSAAEPEADIDAILQTAARSILENMESTLLLALNTKVEEYQPEDYYQVTTASVNTQAEAAAEVADAPITTETDAETDAETPAANGGVLQVGANSDLSMDEVQASLFQNFVSAFEAIETDPATGSSTGTINNLLMAIAQAVGETLVLLGSDSAPQEQVLMLVELFQNTLEASVSQAAGQINNFDVVGVMQSIALGVSQVLTDEEGQELGTKIQSLAGLIINAIIDELRVVVPTFEFSGNIVVVADDSSDTSDDAQTKVKTNGEDDTEPVANPENGHSQDQQEGQVVAFGEPSDKADNELQNEESPLPAMDLAQDVQDAHAAVAENGHTNHSDECMCFDEELFDAMVSAKLQEEIYKILQDEKLI